MKALRGVVLVLALIAGCKKHAAAPPAELPNPGIPAAEVKRGEDACAGYVKAVCACAETVPAAVEDCKMSKMLPEAIRVAMEIGASPDSSRDDTLRAWDSLKKTSANCLTQLAKLPTLGCAAVTSGSR